MYKINRDRLIKTFMELAEISSPSNEEEKIIEYVTAKLSALGIKTKKYKTEKSYNLLAHKNGNLKKTSILFSSHLDTVLPCENVKPLLKGNRITSDGKTILGSDDKSAVAMFLEAMEYLYENKIDHGPIELLFSSAEEIGLYGIKQFDLSLLKSKFAFVYDSDGPVGKIITMAPFHSTMIIKIKGKAAHAGIEPEKGISAVNVIAEIVTNIVTGRFDDGSTTNIGTISGGIATNIVAEEAECKLEVRAFNKKRLGEIESEIKETAKNIAKARGTKIKIIRELQYPGFSIDENDEIIRLTKNAMERIKIKPKLESTGGGSDTNIINRGRHLKAVNLSCGMMNIHSVKEYISVNDLINGTKLTLSLIEIVK